MYANCVLPFSANVTAEEMTLRCIAKDLSEGNLSVRHMSGPALLDSVSALIDKGRSKRRISKYKGFFDHTNFIE